MSEFDQNHYILSIVLTLLMPVFYAVAKAGDAYFRRKEGGN